VIRQTMTDPITPPPELLDLISSGAEAEIAKKILQWAAPILRQQGADQELEACINYFCEYDTSFGEGSELVTGLRAARRPKPPSLKEQALRELGDAYDKDKIDDTTYNTIRAALESQ
jgi:hypothetical protein